MLEPAKIVVELTPRLNRPCVEIDELSRLIPAYRRMVCSNDVSNEMIEEMSQRMTKIKHQLNHFSLITPTKEQLFDKICEVQAQKNDSL